MCSHSPQPGEEITYLETVLQEVLLMVMKMISERAINEGLFDPPHELLSTLGFYSKYCSMWSLSLTILQDTYMYMARYTHTHCSKILVGNNPARKYGYGENRFYFNKSPEAFISGNDIRKSSCCCLIEWVYHYLIRKSLLVVWTKGIIIINSCLLFNEIKL